MRELRESQSSGDLRSDGAGKWGFLLAVAGYEGSLRRLGGKIRFNSTLPFDEMLVPLRTLVELKGVDLHHRFGVRASEVNEPKGAVYGRFGRLISSEIPAAVDGSFTPVEFVEKVREPLIRDTVLRLLAQAGY
jgi:hypothetical protein